jgi:hypothetical protein
MTDDAAPADLTVLPLQLPTATDASGGLVSKVIELASNPGTNPEMFDRLVAWQEREQARQAEMSYNIAMNLAQSEVQPVVRTAENTQTHSFYAKLEQVDDAIRPIYLRHGFSLSYNTVAPLTEGHIRIECRCAHNGGHSEKFYREAPADTLGPKGSQVKTVLHGGGSTETFLKRYLACGIFNVVFKNQDDDGVRGGMKFITEEQGLEIEALLTETKADRVDFMRMFSVNSILEIQEGALAPALNMLYARRERKAKGTGG